MGIKKVDIEEFMQLSETHLILDVRSPSEYLHAHIPGAYSLPLFTDDERKTVGTLYKQRSKEDAIKAGLDFFGVKMRKMVEEVEILSKKQSKNNSVLVHCWRGGMRSAGVAWLLDLYGFNVCTLIGGYKAFRRWAIGHFEHNYPFKVIGGYTGSGKTSALEQLAKRGEIIVDLEAIAKHKGSAFGDIEGVQQPGQEMFENYLAVALRNALEAVGEKQRHIWIEDESQRIGLVNIPGSLWKTMRLSPLYFLEIPFEERLRYLVKEYGVLPKEKLVNAIMRIQKRLGGLDTKMAINYLLENNTTECFRILLKYYDKYYLKALQMREGLGEILHPIKCETADAGLNVQKIEV